VNLIRLYRCVFCKTVVALSPGETVGVSQNDICPHCKSAEPLQLLRADEDGRYAVEE